MHDLFGQMNASERLVDQKGARTTLSRGRCHLAFLLIGLVAAETVASLQVPDVTRRPPVVSTAGGFSARRLVAAPAIDGKKWMEVEVHTGFPSPTVRFPDFSLILVDPGTDTGDFQRYNLLFQRGRTAPVPVDDLTAWVYVTPDSRYIFTEPLYALDVRAWKQYALFQALKIPNYVSIDAISGDGQRLLISRQDCIIDCGTWPREHYELRMPDRSRDRP